MKVMEVRDLVMQARRQRPNTQKNYRQAFRSLNGFVDEWPGSCVVIDSWAASLVGIADSTVRSWYSIIAASAKYMKRAYKLPNPCEDAMRPKVSKKRRRYFSASEIVAIIKACASDYELLLVMTLVDSACRVGEVASLKGGDVGDGFINVAGKTGQRRYRLTEQLCERLRVLAGGDDLPVFRHRNGGFFKTGDGLGQRVRDITVRAGIKGERLGVHTLRHSSASLVAQKTGQALIVKALLQHDNINTSMKYIHDVEDMAIGKDEYSPLRLLGEKFAEESNAGGKEQLKLSGGEELKGSELVSLGGDGLVEVEGASLVGDMFPEIGEGMAVRAVLRYDDLMLIRDAFVFFARYNNGNRSSRARALMRRMVRKGGSKFYSNER